MRWKPSLLNRPIKVRLIQAAGANGIDPTIVKELLMHESSGNPKARSPTGPQGLMQMGKASALDMGIDPNQRFDPDTSIRGGTGYYKKMLDQFGEKYAYAAYHDGPKAVTDYLAGKRKLSSEALRGTIKFGKLHAQYPTVSSDYTPQELDQMEAQLTQQGQQGQQGPKTNWVQDIGQGVINAVQNPGNAVQGLSAELQNRLGGVTQLFGSEYNPMSAVAEELGIPNAADIATNYLTRPENKEALKQPGSGAGSLLADMLITAPTGLAGGMIKRALATGGMEALTTPGNMPNRLWSGAVGTVGSMLGDAAGGVGGFISRPFHPTGDVKLQALVDKANAMNIPLRADQVSGNKSLAYLDSALDYLPSSSAMQEEAKQAQRQAWERALYKEGGQVYDPNINNLAEMKPRVSAMYKDLTDRNDLTVDTAFKSDIDKVKTELLQRVPTNQKSIVKSYIKDLEMPPEGATMSGKTYQDTRSRINEQAQNFKRTDSGTYNALKALRKALDDGMQRGLNATDKMTWDKANKAYMVQKNIEQATDSATQKVSASKLFNQLNKRDPNIMKYGEGPQGFADIARVGQEFIGEKLPNSGTAQRNAAMKLLTNPGSALFHGGLTGAGGFAGPLGALAGAVVSYKLPRLASEAMQNPNGWLVNGTPNILPNIAGMPRDALAKELLRMSTIQLGRTTNNQNLKR